MTRILSVGPGDGGRRLGLECRSLERTGAVEMVDGMTAGAALGLPLVADAAGWAGLALVAGWPLARGRRALLAAQGASAGAFAVHYLLVGAVTGAALCALSIVQAGAAWRDPRPWWCRALYLATLPALAGLVVITWGGPASACAALGLALATAARWQRSTAALRLLCLLSAVAWVAHDVLAGSLPGLLADLLCAGALVYGWARDGRAGAVPAGAA